MKALGTGWARGVRWVDIEVVREPSGKPTLKLSGATREIADRLGVKNIALTITHTETPPWRKLSSNRRMLRFRGQCSMQSWSFGPGSAPPFPQSGALWDPAYPETLPRLEPNVP